MPQPLSVLLLEDSIDDADFITRELRTAGFETSVRLVRNRAELAGALFERSWDIILGDLAGDNSVPAAPRGGAADGADSENLSRLRASVELALRQARHRREHTGSTATLDLLRAALDSAPDANVTEGNGSQQALRESEKRLQLLAINSTDMICSAAPDWTWTYASPACEMLLGYAPEELVGTNLLDHVHPEDKALISNTTFGPTKDWPATFALQMRLRRKDGSYAWVENRGRTIREAGRITELQGSCRDISEWRSALELALAREARLSLVTDQLPALLWTVDDELRITSSTGRALANVGLEPNQPVGQTLYDFFQTEDRNFPEIARHLQALGGASVTYQTTFAGRDFDVRLEPLRDLSAAIIGVVGVAFDVTDRNRADAALARSAALLEQAEAIAHLGSWETNLLTNELRWSDEIYRIVGVSPHEFEANYEAFLSFVHPDDVAALHRAENEALKFGRPYCFDHRIVRPDGEVRYVNEQGKVIFDDDGKPVKFIGTVLDITQRKRAEEHIAYLAQYDGLTGLPNRSLFEDRLCQALVLNEKRRRHAAVLALNLDRFKTINESLGHAKGDELLREIGARLAAQARPGDTVARLAGDTFLVLLTDVADPEDIAPIARRILETVAQPCRIDDAMRVVDASMGIAVPPADGMDAQTLIKNAEAAMHEAKTCARRSFRFCAEKMEVAANRRFELENELRRALEHREFVVFYQPLVSIRTNKVVGAEALIRWRHPERGFVPPDEFIPLAEDTGLIVPIGAWVLEAVCTQWAVWGAAGHDDLDVAVNISPRQFASEELGGLIDRALAKTGIDPRHLDLEITESSIMTQVEAAALILSTLKTKGVKLSLDDFGTGYSSLAHLKRFPLDVMKIDRSFVRDLCTDPDDEAIVRTIITLAHLLGLKAVAEGVETREQLNLLHALGCDVMQGYYFSEPLPAEQFARLLREGRTLD